MEPRLEVCLEEETVWLTLNQIVALFDVQKVAISKHIKNILKKRMMVFFNSADF